MASETPGEYQLQDTERDRRLHPFSPLFVLLTQLRSAAFPLILVLLFGRGSWMELGGLIAAGMLAVYSLVYSFGFRYRLGPGTLFIREGILGRTERHIPYARIQNIVQQRNPLHRMFGVTQLRLESAGGTTPEAEMTVITVAEAERIERVLRGHAALPAAAASPAAPVFELSTGELLRLGLVTNRGLVIVGALFAVLSQFQPPWEDHWIEDALQTARGAGRQWTALVPGAPALVLAALGVAAAFVATLKLLSVVMAVVTFHGFRLRLEGERLSTEMGLLTRRTASARRDKIQRLLVGESWLARRIGRRWLSCDVAAGVSAANEREGTRLRWLAPIARPSALEPITAAVAPGLSIDRAEWRPLHPRAWRRRFTVHAVLVTVASASLIWWVPSWGAAAWLALLLALLLESQGWARFSGYAFADGALGVRSGWLGRQWALVNAEKGQVVQVRQSPFDRRSGMATVVVDTAGASFGGHASSIPYLPEAEARELAARIRLLM